MRKVKLQGIQFLSASLPRFLPYSGMRPCKMNLKRESLNCVTKGIAIIFQSERIFIEPPRIECASQFMSKDVRVVSLFYGLESKLVPV